jgi:hypothetical protein
MTGFFYAEEKLSFSHFVYEFFSAGHFWPSPFGPVFACPDLLPPNSQFEGWCKF